MNNPTTEPLAKHIALDALTPHTRNYNTHPAEQIARLRESLRTYGQPRPIVVHRGVILAGHGVYMAAREEGWRQIWCSIVPDEWTEAQAIGYLVADNETRRGAEPDEVALLQLIEETRHEVGLEALGFDEDALQALRDEVMAADALPEPGDGGDDFDTTPDEGTTRAQLGDLWIIGGKHHLIVGDCTDPAVVARLMRGERADAVVTDPPYGIGVDYGTFNDTPENVKDLIVRFMPIALQYTPIALTPGVPSMWNYPRPDWVGSWTHPAPTSSGPWGFIGSNPILYYGKDPYLAQGKGRRDSSIVMVAHRKTDEDHPVAKPIDVWVWLVERMTPNLEAIIFDPFLGSGTTLIAAHRTGRRCYGCEIEPKYADVILRRAEAEQLSVELTERL